MTDEQLYIRNPAVAATEIDAETFLVEPETGEVFYLDEQVDEDILWIRGEFLGDRSDHGKCIVHGHTITDDIDVRQNRIGIDTGAYYSGTLSCLVLDGESRAVLQT